MRIDDTFFLAAVSGAVIEQGSFSKTSSFSIDSRTLQKGDIFIALSGARSDGHDFLADVIEGGAAGIIIAEKQWDKLDALSQKTKNGLLIATVPNTLTALIALARIWRKRFTMPVVAITGSVGKTSTKMVLATILKEHKTSYLTAHGNQNTLLGVALNILRMNETHDGAVFEIGINHRGEMARIVDLLRPTTALITCVGHSHMEGLGSVVDIAAEKRDIFKFLEEDSVGIVNGDQPVLAQVSYPHPVIKFGLKMTNQIQARKVSVADGKTKFVLKIYHKKIPIVLPHIHSGMLMNVLAAVAVARYLEVPNNIIVQAIEKPIVVARRFEKHALPQSESVVIDDCYNANPESMKAALLALQEVNTDAQKIAVLGDMLELGADGAFWHRQLGRFLRKVPSLQHLILVGDLVKWTKKTVPISLKVDIVSSWKEAIPFLQKHLNQKSILLVKGSRSVGLDHVVAHFVRDENVQPT